MTPNYVGRHGSLLRSRCSQHSGGFHSRYGSGPGQRNAENIRVLLGLGRAVGIYAKPSADPAAEEDELIDRFRPDWELWNRKGPRRAARDAVEAAPAIGFPGETDLVPDDFDLLPDEAKRRLAATFGVSPENIEITIRF